MLHSEVNESLTLSAFVLQDADAVGTNESARTFSLTVESFFGEVSVHLPHLRSVFGEAFSCLTSHSLPSFPLPQTHRRNVGDEYVTENRICAPFF